MLQATNGRHDRLRKVAHQLRNLRQGCEVFDYASVAQYSRMESWKERSEVCKRRREVGLESGTSQDMAHRSTPFQWVRLPGLRSLLNHVYQKVGQPQLSRDPGAWFEVDPIFDESLATAVLRHHMSVFCFITTHRHQSQCSQSFSSSATIRHVWPAYTDYPAETSKQNSPIGS